MSTHKSIDFICVVVLILTLALTFGFINGERFGIQIIRDADAEGSSGSDWFTANDLKADWSDAGATVITLKGDTASVTGGGAYFYDGKVIIASAGHYVLRGTLDDGGIVVDAEKRSKVWLLLDGVTLNCSDDACLRVDQADKVFLTLAEGSENRMTSGESYSDAALADKTDGVIFAHDDLTINGSGSLTLTAAYKHGISANDDLVITGGSITVSAPQDALRANDSLRICGAVITCEAGDDALVLNGADGTLYIESGTLELSSAADGVHSAGELLIAGGDLVIRAGDEGIQSEGSVTLTGGSLDISAEGKGIRSEASIQLTDGSLNIRAADDAIHSGGDVLIEGGDLVIRAGDDGIHADAAVTVTGGTLMLEECYEGVEALTIDISGGELSIYPTDDGLNANGGSGGFGFGSTAETDTETWIHISGGTITVVNETARDADGLDSNGDLIISGGVIRVSLPAGGTNSALDYGSESGGVCTVTGGEIVACGSYTMAEAFDESSTQCAILYNFSEGAAAGTTVSVETLDGETLVSYTVPCSFNSVALSSPKMQVGESYRIVIGSRSEEITLTETAASYGNAASSMFGGTMNWSGAPRPGGRPGSRPDGEASDGEQMGTPPDMPDFSGEAPEGEPPEMPDFGGDPPEMPDFGGEAPNGEQMGPPPNMPDFSGASPQPDETPAVEETEEAEETETQFVPTAETWILLALSFLALAGGVIFAGRFEP